jgi:hypothetical protein
VRGAWVVAVVALLLSTVGVVESSAQESDEGGVLLILDASGSMNRVDDNGVVLIDGAKQALTRLIDGLPDGSQVGLMVYGHRVPNDDKVNGCQDVELVVPVGPLDRDGMSQAIEGVTARGFTPIGRSLEEAAAALPHGRGTIILVSDGEDTCAPPDPCEVAAALLDRGIDVRVHTVGFFLEGNQAARNQLQCIAEATDGTYREVDAIEELATELGVLVSEALPPGPELAFVPLDGGLSIELAPVVPFTSVNQPENSLQSNIEGMISPGDTRWYTIDVDDGPLGMVVSCWVDALVPDALPGDSVRVSIVDGEGGEYQTGSSRFGREEIELVTVEAAEEAILGTTASFNGFDVLWADDPNIEQAVAVLGLDQEEYDAIVREMLLRPAPPPLTDGRYYVTIQWDAEPSDEERRLEMIVALWPHSEVKHLTYAEVEGSPAADSASVVSPPDVQETWMPPLDETITNRGGFLGSIESAEQRWYAVSVPPGSTVSVRAFLNRPLGAIDAGEFRVDLHDASGNDIGQDRPEYPRALALDDVEALHSDGEFGHPNGIAPRPLVGATATASSQEVLISFTWDGQPGETGQVEFVVDLVAGDDSADFGSAEEPQSEEPAAVAEQPEDSDALPVVIGAVGLVVLAGGVVGFWIYRRRNIEPV